MKAIGRGEVERGIERLVIARARTELSQCLLHLNPVVRESLEIDRTRVAMNAYELLEDYKSLDNIAQNMIGRGRMDDCLQAVLKIKKWPGKQQEYLEKFFMSGAYREVAQLIRSVYPEQTVENTRLRNPEPYSRLINGIHGKLLASFGDEEADRKNVRAPIRHMMDVLEYCGEYDRLKEFFDNCESAGDCNEWRYHTGDILLRMSQKTHRGAADAIISYMGMNALDRGDDQVIAMVLTHRFDREQAMNIAAKLMQKGRRRQAFDLVLRVLQDDGIEPEAFNILSDFKPCIRDEETHGKQKRKRN